MWLCFNLNVNMCISINLDITNLSSTMENGRYYDTSKGQSSNIYVMQNLKGDIVKATHVSYLYFITIILLDDSLKSFICILIMYF